MTYHWCQRRRSLRLRRRCRPRSHSPQRGCPPVGGAHGGGGQYPWSEGGGGVLELWPGWSAGGGGGQYPVVGGSGQYPPGAGGSGHVGGCSDVGDPPNGIMGGGPYENPAI
jgi:hypothetical protein